jgi:putative transposase
MMAGARKARACEVVGISIRTLQRWMRGDNLQEDKRSLAIRPEPRNKLTMQERERIIEVCNCAEFSSLPPSQIVPRLADQGEYIASESSFYRVLKTAGQLNARGRAKARQKVKPPTTHVAKHPNQLWSWDVSYLPSKVRGQFYYLYLVEDVYSRKGVGWEVHLQESGEDAAELIQRTIIREQCFLTPLVLHADNGAPMKSQTLQAKLYELGITPSHSRPRVSNDNPFSEALFRTVKYCPSWPSEGFASLEQARQWVNQFMQWYNHEHCHSGIRFVTPAQRHAGLDGEILANRKKVYEQAKSRNPCRWSGNTRNWTPVGEVALNPEKEKLQEKIAA